MTYFLNFIFPLFVILLAGYHLYKDTKNKLWNALAQKYPNKETGGVNNKPKVQMVFFKTKDDSEYEAFNSMNVTFHDDGIEFTATLNHYFLKSVFLPFDEIEEVEKKWLFLSRFTIYHVKKLDIYVGV